MNLIFSLLIMSLAGLVPMELEHKEMLSSNSPSLLHRGVRNVVHVGC